MPVRKTATTKQTENYYKCVENVERQNKIKKSRNKYNPWAICNASIFNLLETQKGVKK